MTDFGWHYHPGTTSADIDAHYGVPDECEDCMREASCPGRDECYGPHTEDEQHADEEDAQ